MLTFIFLLTIVVLAFHGYRRGVLPIAFRLISLAAAYLMAFLFTSDVASWLGDVSPIHGIMGYLVSGAALFIITSLLLDILFKLLNEAVSNKTGEPSTASRVAGIILGGATGTLVGIILVWVISLVSQVIQQTQDPQQLPQSASSSAIEQWARKATGGAIRSAIRATTQQDDVADFTAQLLEQPEVAIAHMRQVIESDAFRNLFLTQRNQLLLNRGNLKEISRLPEFKQLLDNPGFKALTQNWIDHNSSIDPKLQVAERIRDLWARAQFIKRDKEVLAIINDPQIKLAIQEADVIKLLNDERIVQLFKRIASKEADAYSLLLQEKEYEQVDLESSTSAQQQPIDPTSSKARIYRWVDKNGRVHYSDKKPEDSDQ